ncbi:MAG: ferritin-like domain-containing protein [Methylophilaceae bacterium]
MCLLQADVLSFATGLEKGTASAYLSALPELHNKDLVSAADSILGDETMHWAILLNALGEGPVSAAFIG